MRSGSAAYLNEKSTYIITDLMFASVNLFYLPGHTTWFLQPLDRCFIKIPKQKNFSFTIWKTFVEAWSGATTVDTAVLPFKTTGIFPFNSGTIPEYVFLESKVEELINTGSSKFIPIDSYRLYRSAKESESQIELQHTDQ